MKNVMVILQWILIVVLIFAIFFWLLAATSGHKIPDKTNTTAGVASLILVILLVLTVLIKRKIN